MGRASARLFAQEGATVFIAGRNEERGEELVQELNDGGGAAHFVELTSSTRTSGTPRSPGSRRRPERCMC
jgi:NAD(P)-dependent dehydrogenase (short-subunit alcohol dehydrogenase family)